MYVCVDLDVCRILDLCTYMCVCVVGCVESRVVCLSELISVGV